MRSVHSNGQRRGVEDPNVPEAGKILEAIAYCLVVQLENVPSVSSTW